MARASRHKKGGRTTPKGTQPANTKGRGHQHHGPNLVDDARRALRDTSPISLMAMASGIIELCMPRPLDTAEETENRPVLLETIHSFLHASPGLAAVTAVIGELVPDEHLAAHIRDDVATAKLPAHMPPWIGAMADAEAYDVMKMAHPYNDGDDYLVGVHWPSGEMMSAVVYIDHNIGSAVKDAFLLPDSPEGLRLRFSEMPAQDVTIEATSAADAKARISAAIARGELTEGIEPTESWPAARSVIEWMISLLPEGGTAYDTEPISDADAAAVIDDFVQSSFATGLELPDETLRAVVQPLIWFAHDYVGGDALRVSPLTVDILLGDWYVNKVELPTIQMILLPMILKAWTRYAHGVRGLPEHMTTETIEAIDRWAPSYVLAVDDRGDIDPRTGEPESSSVDAGGIIDVKGHEIEPTSIDIQSPQVDVIRSPEHEADETPEVPEE